MSNGNGAVLGREAAMLAGGGRALLHELRELPVDMVASGRLGTA